MKRKTVRNRGNKIRGGKTRGNTRGNTRGKTVGKTVGKSKGKVSLARQKELVLNLMREFKWPKTERANVLKKSQKNYEGFALGWVKSWAGKGENAGYKDILSLKTRDKKYKELYRETKKIMRLADPKFKFTTIQFNKNHKAERHIDGKNVGVSYIIGLGDYSGGELIVYDENEKNPVRHDIKNKFFKFNGSKCPHETAPFRGERYTLVFYSIR